MSLGTNNICQGEMKKHVSFISSLQQRNAELQLQLAGPSELAAAGLAGSTGRDFHPHKSIGSVRMCFHINPDTYALLHAPVCRI